jgi:hypothetical protein
MSRLNEKDLELLQTGQTTDLASAQDAYLGGEFTTNSNDYIQVLIYDTNNNFIESGIADPSDYSYDKDNGVKLNTGTILRKMGYDRGRYVVKYNFLRKAAGSYETILVDSQGNRWLGDYHTMPGGTIMTGQAHSDTAKVLFLKEYKYFIHEISPSRKEVRLAPQPIEDDKYLNDFYYAQKQVKKITLPNLLSFSADSDALKPDSTTLQVEGNFPITKQMVGGFIAIDNAFIERYIEPPGTSDGSDTTPTNEVESNVIQAKFIISNEDAAQYLKGDRSMSKIYDRFVGLEDSAFPTDDSGIKYESRNLKGIYKLKYDIFDPPVYKQKDPNNATLSLKSVSSKPNVSTKYTWEITGYDWSSSSGWGKISAHTSTHDGDVSIDSPTPSQNSLLKVTEESTTGSEIRITIWSTNTHVGVKLTIEPKDGQPSTIHLPAAIVTLPG